MEAPQDTTTGDFKENESGFYMLFYMLLSAEADVNLISDFVNLSTVAEDDKIYYSNTMLVNQ